MEHREELLIAGRHAAPLARTFQLLFFPLSFSFSPSRAGENVRYGKPGRIGILIN